ncbi:MAG: oligosaccharide flippase family protein [Ignavibacteriaceae bacterium]|nr:oligosaccharide flippase family protein [Ignavibacteriaceae bacterium]
MFDKLKELTKDTAIYGISTMVGRFINFLLVPFYTNIFLPEQYGVITNIYAFIGIMNIVYIYGMDSAYLKFASTQEIGDKKDNFSTPFISIFLTSLLLSVTIYAASVPLNNLLAVPGNYHYLMLFSILILFLDANTVVPFIKLRLERKAKKFAAFKIISILINVCLTVFLVLKLKMGIEAVFISNAAASLAALILLLPDILAELKFSLKKELFQRLLKFGLPYLPAGFSLMLIQVIDRPIMEHLQGLAALGVYQANYKLGIFMMLFVNMFQFAWQPFFLQNAKEKNAKEMFSKVLTYFTLVGSVILIGLSLFISDFVQWKIFGRTIIGPNYWGGTFIVPIVLLAYLFNGFYVIFNAGIYIKEKSIYAPIVTTIAAFANVVFNLLLIPPFGILGAAFATLISYIVMSGGLYIVTQKFYRIEYEIGKIIKMFLLIAITGAIFYSFGNFTIPIYYRAVLFLAFIIGLLIFIIDKDEINFIKQKLARRR